MKARIAAATFAAVLFTLPLFWVTGWAPLLALLPAALLATFAVCGD